MSVLNYFIGTPQSKYAGAAIIATVLVICLAIIFTNTEVPIGNRIVIAVFVLLLSIFPIAISLFELTCIVTGGKNTAVNLCGYFAWFVTVLVVIYCFILILVTLTSMFTYKKAYGKLEVAEKFTASSKLSDEHANKIARDILSESFADSGVPSLPAVAAPSPVPVVPAPAQASKEDKKNDVKPVEAFKPSSPGMWSGYEKSDFMPLQ